MGKHTPGPWSLRISDNSWQNRYQIQRSDGACLFSFEDSPLHNDAEADARLIAAAPDLLEACQAARALTPDGTHTASVLDAAIAKATGAGHG